MKGDLHDRLAQLERDIRRVRGVLLLLLVVAAGLLLAIVLPRGRAEAIAVFSAAALLLAGAETAVYVWRRGQGLPDIVRAKKFEVVDESGHVFVEIGETTDGRGAVVTHDGDTHVVLMPAHPPDGDRTGEALQPSVATPAGHAAQAAGTSRTGEPLVAVKLMYRGNGVYEAKITERGDAAQPAAEPAKEDSR